MLTRKSSPLSQEIQKGLAVSIEKFSLFKMLPTNVFDSPMHYSIENILSILGLARVEITRCSQNQKLLCSKFFPPSPKNLLHQSYHKNYTWFFTKAAQAVQAFEDKHWFEVS